MDDKTTQFLTKKGIDPSDVMYIVRNDRKTVLYMTDGRTYETYIALKNMLEALPKDLFIKINKGCVVFWEHITRIEDGRYYMKDGSVHNGRLRTPSEHSRNSVMIDGMNSKIGLKIRKGPRNYEAVDEVDVGLVMLELVYNNGQNMRLFVRHCNERAASMVNHRPEELVDRPLLDVCPLLNKKFAFKVADVALNGASKDMILRDKGSPKTILIHCYQTDPDQCALTMTDITSLDGLESFETELPPDSGDP